MKTINASEFKARCLAIMDEVSNTGELITILKRGKPVAQLIPPVPVEETFPQQTLLHTVEINDDLTKPVIEPEAWEAVRGNL